MRNIKMEHTIPLLKTKLYQPFIPSDFMVRERLLKKLSENKDCYLTLVSAPAGYGKSSIVSHWLSIEKRQSCWVSLDTYDNALQQFLVYFIAAIQTISSTSLSKSFALINAFTHASTEVIFSTLINEIDEMEDDFTIILDDIHHITDPEILNFLNRFFAYSPRGMKIVLIGRQDPFLNISSLRAKGLLNEVRMAHLRFSEQESIDFIQNATEQVIDIELLKPIVSKNEGWVTGLRLASLSMKELSAPSGHLRSLVGSHKYITDYLINDILANQSAEIRHMLLITSVLDRFCAPLCDALKNCSDNKTNNSVSGEEFITFLRKNGLFIIALDEHGTWFRFHHLFQELIFKNLKTKVLPEQATSLFSCAANWCEENQFVDEAIGYMLKVNDITRLETLIIKHRHADLDKDNFTALKRRLALLPESNKQNNVALLLSQAWCAFFNFNVMQVFTVVDRINVLLKDRILSSIEQTEVHFFKGICLFYMGNIELAYAEFKLGLSCSSQQLHVMCRTEYHLNLCRCLMGETADAVSQLEHKISSSLENKGLHIAFQVGTLVWMKMLDGDLPATKVQASQHISIAKKSKIPNSVAWSLYMYGFSAFNGGELAEAQQYFSDSVEQRYIIHTSGAIQAFSGSVLTAQLAGDATLADRTLTQFLDFVMEFNVPDYLLSAQSCQARLALLQGDINRAMQWAISYDQELTPMSLYIWLEVPAMTQARIFTMKGGDQYLGKAEALLIKLQVIATQFHFNNQLLDIQLLLALTYIKRNEKNNAIIAFNLAVEIAEKGSWVRPFQEIGTDALVLFSQLETGAVQGTYYQSILSCLLPAKYNQKRMLPDTLEHVDVLTKRELEILKLMHLRLQHKEIANRLFVSVPTVKSHVQHIYQKLSVKNRLQACEKALLLGVFE